jgi:hypothetical protein
VVRGGGETRRRTLIALAISFIMICPIALVLAKPVSADNVVVTIPDKKGDLGMYDVFFNAANKSGGVALVNVSWGDHAPMMKARYLDMVSISFGMRDEGTYVFGMKLAADLPQAGTALPHGIKLIAWLLWLDRAPWTPSSNPGSYYEIYLMYDGTSYSTVLSNTATHAVTSVPSTIEGSTFQMQISTDSIGNLASFWWSAATFALTNWNTLGWCTDLNDPGVAPGQVWFDIPWPPQ